jgi:ABC-type Mn2+/Zn2+ transport system permease subunit
VSYLLGAIGYAVGLGISLFSDLPPGPLIVCTMAVMGFALFLILRPQAPK